MIVCACAGIGWIGTRRLYEAERRWRAWVTMLSRLHEELRYTACPVQEAFARIYKDDLSALPWLAQYREPHGDLCCPRDLNGAEQAFAASFFAVLGTADLEGLLSHIAQTRQQADERFLEASERRRRLASVYTSLGVCAGLCVGLIML